MFIWELQMKDKFLKSYNEFFWIFIIGSFIGFVHENLLMIFKGQMALRQGLIYEPLIPVYGVGFLIFYIIYSLTSLDENNKLVSILKGFILGFFGGGVIEYLFSFLQEKIFGTISWDYSYLMFNFNGRTSLFHMTFWGFLGVLFALFVLPLLDKFIKNIRNYKWITKIITYILIFDCLISFFACLRQNERRYNKKANNFFEVLLDKYYPDKYLNSIFNNAKVVKGNNNEK